MSCENQRWTAEDWACDRNWHPGDLSVNYSKIPQFPYLKLYLPEERAAVRVDNRYLAQYLESIGGPDQELLHRIYLSNKGIPYTVIRFCDSIKGFHTGSLDLSGRHPARYASLHKYWLSFRADVDEIFRHTTLDTSIQEEPDQHDQHSATFERVSYFRTFAVSPHSLQESFEKKWRLRLCAPMLLQELCEKVIQCLARCPDPVFQRRRLLDLPPEMLHRIAYFTARDSDNCDVRSLGRTCKLWRSITTPHIYTVRILEMKPTVYSPELDHLCCLLDEEKRRCISQAAKLARNSFLQSADFLGSRPDIATRVKHLDVNNWDDELLQTGFPTYSPRRRLGFKFTFSRSLQTVLPFLLHLSELTLDNVVITSAVAQQLVSIPQLETLHLLNCKVTSKFRRVRIRSDVLRHLVMEFSDHDPYHSLWRLVQFFPSLRTIVTIASWKEVTEALPDPPRLLPYVETWGDMNPFTLQSLTRIQLYNLSFDLNQWDLLLSLLENSPPLSLTHLAVTTSDPFNEAFTFALVEALRPAALEQLVLDGTLCASLGLFDRIREAFPTLTSLTLKYRKGLSYRETAEFRKYSTDRTHWPHASWEYAQALARFPRLTHFGWNSVQEVMISPSVLLRFECDYADPLDDDLVVASELEDDEDEDGPVEYLEDPDAIFFFPKAQDPDDEHEARVTLALFARVCPNLRSFATASHVMHYFERDGDELSIVTSGYDKECKVHDPPSQGIDHPWALSKYADRQMDYKSWC